VSAAQLVALPGGQPDRPVNWEQLLRAAVRPEFQVDIYRPEPGDPVLFGPTCVVAGCDARGLQRAEGIRGHLCQAHAAMWRRDGEPPQGDWLRDGARSLRRERAVTACAAAGCQRSTHTQGLCQPHYNHYRRAGRPPLDVFVTNAPATRTGVAGCRVEGCSFPAIVGHELCDAHHKSFRWLRWRRPDFDLDRFLEHVETGRERGGPRFDLRGVGPIVALELGYALQCRKDARGAAITALIFGQVIRWLRDRPVDSLLIGSDAAWARAAEERFSAGCRANPLAWVRHCRKVLQRLRDERHGDQVWEWDTWPTDRIDPGGRYAHQPVRRIYFADIEPDWLRALAKRWARWRITTTTKSPASVAVSTSSLRRFCGWLADRDALPAIPSQITRGLLEDYRAHVHTLDVSPGRRNGLLTDLKVFLDDVRLHDWAPGLPSNATYYRGEIPHKTTALPRFVDEFVMGQLEREETLDRLPDLTTRTAVVILIQTGLRSVDCLRLPFDPITTDEAGAPYLRFYNHKLSKDAIIPISDRLVAQIRRQQQDLRERFRTPPSILLPRVRKNPDGELPFLWSALNNRLRRWLSDCEVRDACGRPVKVTAHQFRHTVGTRMINNEVSMDTVQRMLDHASPEMTARYATIKDQTLRREWERFQQRINIQGELIPLDPAGSPMSDAAWALENLARAKQTLPNGYCGLPLQQTCPHPNACLTCDSFLTTVEFLPQHRDQLARTEELIAEAEAQGRRRLVEMNEPVRLNLIRIIDGLKAIEVDDGC
jgi:integrase